MEERSIEKNAIEQNALELVYTSTLNYADQLQSKETFEEATTKFRMINKNLFGLEVDAKRIIEWKLRELVKEENRSKLPARYLPFSLVPLLWRTECKDRLPKIVPFDLNSPCFRIGGYMGAPNLYTQGWMVQEPIFPAAIQECYRDDSNNNRLGNARIVSKYVIFHGFIPERIKEEIFEAKKFFDHIFLLAEVGDKDWITDDPMGGVMRINAVGSMGQGADPLVIGYKDGYCWLIVAFDITPLERIAISISG